MDTSNSNYSEIVVFEHEFCSPEGWRIYETNLSESMFTRVMKSFSHDKRFKFFQKEYKAYTKGDIVCENRGNKDIRVFQRLFVRAEDKCQPHLVRMHYDLSKLPYHQFPSTMHIHDISYVKRMSAKLHNRVSIHFESSMNPSKNINVNRIFISCNSDGNVDVDNLEHVLQNLVTDLEQAIQTTRIGASNC